MLKSTCVLLKSPFLVGQIALFRCLTPPLGPLKAALRAGRAEAADLQRVSEDLAAELATRQREQRRLEGERQQLETHCCCVGKILGLGKLMEVVKLMSWL